MPKYFGELHVFKSGVNSKYVEIDFVDTTSHLLAYDMYHELMEKIKAFMSTVEDVIDEFHDGELEGLEKFHSDKFIYFYRIDIFKKYDYNDSCWLYRSFTKSGSYPEYSKSPKEVYAASLEKLEKEFRKIRKGGNKA